MSQPVPPRRTKDRVPEAVAFGAAIRRLRLERGWTQEQLAEAAGINPLQLGHIERGANEPKLTTIMRLARALKLSCGDLLKC